jgi:hypothetical protein
MTLTYQMQTVHDFGHGQDSVYSASVVLTGRLATSSNFAIQYFLPQDLLISWLQVVNQKQT